MKYTLFWIIAVIASTTTFCKAQSMSFQINSIASTSNMTVSSLSFQVAANANCLFVANGLAMYKPIKSTAAFQLGCTLPMVFDRYGVKINPQPIGNNPRIHLIQPTIPNTIFSVRWYNVSGRMVLETTTNGLTLSTGMTMNTSRLSAGTYIVQVLSARSIDLLQVIKQD